SSVPASPARRPASARTPPSPPTPPAPPSPPEGDGADELLQAAIAPSAASTAARPAVRATTTGTPSSWRVKPGRGSCWKQRGWSESGVSELEPSRPSRRRERRPQRRDDRRAHAREHALPVAHDERRLAHAPPGHRDLHELAPLDEPARGDGRPE